jgi:hypothetical protein
MQKFLWIIFPIVFCFASCDDKTEDFSNDPGDLLSFSTDTISFDTLLTTVNSPVKAFRVYNRNRRPLIISSVDLENGAESPFKINVDGYAGRHFDNLEIRANDSIYVMVDVNPDDLGTTVITRISDCIVFVTNGISQKVVLEAYGQDIFHYKELVIDSDTTLNPEKPYLIINRLEVAEGAVLTVPEGTVFYMYNNAEFIVNGTVRMTGTVENPIVFRGSRTDYLPLAKPIPYDLIPNQWGGIRFGKNSYDNELENVRIRNGKFGLAFDISMTDRKKAVLKNTIITNVSGNLINAVNCDISAENCEFSNSGGISLSLIGGMYEFTHCTIANYYPSFPEAGWKKSEHQILRLANSTVVPGENSEEVQVICPLEKADFNNTVLASVKTDMVIFAVKYEDAALNYRLNNCLLTDRPFEDENLVNCIFGAHPDSLFVDCKGSDAKGEDFLFDFKLRENSPAKDVANPEISQSTPIDMLGRNRLADGKPDIGAYERE